MVETGGLVLETLAAGHLETEEGAHGLLGGIGILLALLFLDWLGRRGVGSNLRSSDGGVVDRGGGGNGLLALGYKGD